MGRGPLGQRRVLFSPFQLLSFAFFILILGGALALPHARGARRGPAGDAAPSEQPRNHLRVGVGEPLPPPLTGADTPGTGFKLGHRRRTGPDLHQTKQRKHGHRHILNETWIDPETQAYYRLHYDVETVAHLVPLAWEHTLLRVDCLSDRLVLHVNDTADVEQWPIGAIIVVESAWGCSSTVGGTPEPVYREMHGRVFMGARDDDGGDSSAAAARVSAADVDGVSVLNDTEWRHFRNASSAYQPGGSRNFTVVVFTLPREMMHCFRHAKVNMRFLPRSHPHHPHQPRRRVREEAHVPDELNWGNSSLARELFHRHGGPHRQLLSWADYFNPVKICEKAASAGYAMVSATGKLLKDAGTVVVNTVEAVGSAVDAIAQVGAALASGQPVEWKDTKQASTS